MNRALIICFGRLPDTPNGRNFVGERLVMINATPNPEPCAAPLLLPKATAVAVTSALDDPCPAADDLAVEMQTTLAVAADAAVELPTHSATIAALVAVDAAPCADAVERTVCEATPETEAEPEEFASTAISFVTISPETALVADAEDVATLETNCTASPVAAAMPLDVATLGATFAESPAAFPAPLDAAIVPTVGLETTLVLTVPATAPTEAVTETESPFATLDPSDAASDAKIAPETASTVATAADDPALAAK